MRTNDLGNPLAPSRKVTSHKGVGWSGVPDEKRAIIGWAYVYICTLECGHEQRFVTKMQVSRGGDPPAPFQMHCEKCWRQRAPDAAC